MFKSVLFFILILTNITFSNPIPWQMLNDGKAPENKSHDCNSKCCNSDYSYLNSNEFQANITRTPYNVLSYSVNLDFSLVLRTAELEKDTNMRNYYSGTQKIILKIDSAGQSEISLDASDMSILSVLISGKKQDAAQFGYKYQDNQLIITDKSNFIVDDTITLVIDYSVDRDYRKGFYMYAPGKYTIGQSKITVVEPLAYTMSQPSFARYWMPCNDKSYDKAISNISVTVPQGYKGVSNGLLDSTTSNEINGLSTETFHYSHKSPISTYLMVATASKFGYYEQKYPRFSDNKDTINIDNYAWQVDIDVPENHPFNTKKSLVNQPEMLRYFSSRFGEYTFEKYGTVALHPFEFGGMEHTTMTSINRDWLRGWGEVGLAHEVAHHWIGDLITCATWNDIWINEGGATWFEALWLENLTKSESAYYQQMYSKLDYFFKQSDAHLLPVYGIPESKVFVKSYMTYNKAGWAYHMLSEVVGRNEFYDVMKKTFEENKFKALTSQDFQELLKSNIVSSKMDIDLFFDQWVYGTGYIKYSLDIEQIPASPDKFKYNVSVNQIQNGNGYRDVYEMPVDIIFTDLEGNLLAIKPVHNNLRSQVYTFEFDFPVKNAFIDDRKVLCKNIKMATTVDDNIIEDIAVYPNPASDYITIVLPSTKNSNHTLKGLVETGQEKVHIFNILGIEVSSAGGGVNEVDGGGYRIDISKLNSGIYFIKIGNHFHKIIKI
jgi:aminopeptidase N